MQQEELTPRSQPPCPPSSWSVLIYSALGLFSLLHEMLLGSYWFNKPNSRNKTWPRRIMWLGLLKSLYWARRTVLPGLSKLIMSLVTSLLHDCLRLCGQVFIVNTGPGDAGSTSILLGKYFTGFLRQLFWKWLWGTPSEVKTLPGLQGCGAFFFFFQNCSCLQIWKTASLWWVCFPWYKGWICKHLFMKKPYFSILGHDLLNQYINGSLVHMEIF